LLFWTGDNSPHAIWEENNDSVAESTLLTTKIIKKVFKGAPIAVYPCTGNHDTWPVNVQDFREPNINFPINQFKDSWSEWIGPEATRQMAEYGYFSVDFKLPNGELVAPGAKIIGL